MCAFSNGRHEGCSSFDISNICTRSTCLWQINRRFHFETENLSVSHGGNVASISDNAHREKRKLVTILFYIAMKMCHLQNID